MKLSSFSYESGDVANSMLGVGVFNICPTNHKKPKAFGQCGLGMGCSGGQGECGLGMGCGGSGNLNGGYGQCGLGMGCSGGGGQCGLGLGCGGW